jgi:pristinamycin I synthase-3/4
LPFSTATSRSGNAVGWSAQRLQEEEDYWRANLGDLPPIPVQLPLDRPRPAAQSHRGATHSFDLGGDLTHGLRDLAQTHNVTLFMLLHAAYAVLLARYSGQTDIVVGSPIANRRVAALEPLVGFFVNTLVLRHQVDPSEPFLTLLDRVSQTALSAYDHQDLPFEHLVDLLNPDRNLAHAPIFQVGLVLQNMQQQRLDLPDLTLVAAEAKAVTAKFDLALTLSEAGRQPALRRRICHRPLSMRPASNGSAADFVRLLHAIVATPSRVVHQLAPPATADLDRIARWNSTETPITEPSVVAAIEAQAARQPDAVALIWQDARMSYGDLDRAANRIAHALRADGVRPGMLVGLGTGRGIAHVCGGLGILKAGACLVMLPMDAPEERLNYILADTGLRHVVGFASGNWPDAVAVIDPAADGHAETPLGLAASVDRSYVVYTSGTTGQPKGSVNSLIGLANFCEWYGRAYDLAPGHVVSSVSNVAFDGTVAEIWPTLTHGATLVLVPEDTLRDPWLLSAMLTEHGVNTLYLPMGYLDAIARSGFDWPSTLRRVLAGGDRMKGYLLPRELGLELVNVYGPSETQCVSSVEPIGPNHKGQVSIGRPIPNTRIHILDPLHNPLPPGAVGEICIAGIGVGEGYLNRPSLTAEKFVPDPFGPPGARMYLSGDMGRFLPDGRIDFVGRTDGQLKIRGFRIELDEIERAILDQPDVAETVVIAQKDEQAGHRLVAYVVPRRDASRDASHWQATFEQIYRDESQATGDSRFDIVGWTDSYTGAPIPADEMVEWLQETVTRIMSCNPASVLEVGVGTGMILHRVAPHAKRYTGTDLSSAVLENLAGNLSADNCPVDLHHCAADNWSQFAHQQFDTIILNSVAQYFPSIEYLEHWLAEAVAHVDEGEIFLGDIRNFTLAEAFALSILDHSARPETSAADLRSQLARHLSMEPELLVDPNWFFAIAAQNPRITAVRVLPKKGAAINELTRFRFDVVLSVDKDSPRHPEDWQEFEGLAALQVALNDGPARLALRNIPDSRTRVAQDKARLLRDLPGQASLAQLRKHCETLEAGIDVNVLYELAADGGYRVELCLGAGGLNAVFWRTGDAPNWSSLFASAPRRAARHANVPYQPEQNAALVANLNQALSARLPAYMLPWRIIPLSSLPLTVNGKVDRRALPVPAVSVGGGDGLLGGVGLRVAGIWGEVLGLSAATFGGEENFFALGGHSLLATQVISKIRAGFGVEMPLRALFEQPTIRGLAALIEAEMLSGEAALPAPVAEPRVAGGPQGFPLSFAQARLWFLDQLAPGDLAYSLPVALAIEGPLDVSALAAAFGGLVARHEVLRSRFVLQGGAPVQIIDPVAEGPFELPLTDLGAGLGAGEMLEGLSDADRQEAVAAAIQAEAGTSFQLAQGPLLRARLLALGRDSHVLIVNMHHIVSDGWSMGVLLREIAHLYEAHVAGRTPDLPPLPVQYADYAQWQRDWLQGAALDRQLAYWQGHLKGLPGLLALPTDRPRPPVQSHRGAALALTLDAGLVARLEALGRAQGATLHMVLTGVLSVLLARWSGQDDIAIGTPVAGRRHEALEGLIGFFVNTLVLRTRIDPEEDFAALLDRVRDDALEGLAHQDLPFEHLVEAMAPARDLSHAPLFQVMLALQNAPLGEMGFGGLSLSPIGFDASHAKFDITLSLQDDLTGPASDGGHRALSGTLEYATDLFDAATMARLAGQFVQLARAVADAPRQPCATLPLMSAEDRDRTIAAWAAKPGPETTRARTGQTLAQLFEDAVRRWPERTALRHEGTSIGYDQLNRRANQMAHHLMALGAGPDQVIGICTQRCPEMIVAILAILKAGAAYLPLDPDHPDDRIAYMLADANPGIVLTTPDLTPRLETLTQASILDLTQPLDTPDTNTKPKTTPNNLAYVIYTSGSTGKPKGTMVENDAVVRLFSATDDWFDFNETDVWTLFHSYAFDFSVWEIFGALLNGGRMVIVPWLTSRDPEAFHTLLAEEGVTVLNQTPSAFGQLSNHRLALAEPAPLALRLVIFGGEALNRTALQPWFDRHGHDKPQLVNMYGITETTVHVTYQPLVDAPLAIGAIGVPIPDLQTRVLDSALNPLPPGVRGELFVAGPGLARGYLNRPALTAERFVPDPYGPPGARLYRSGDLARILEDGTLEYMGRADAQVKIRGFRIETGEIEAALSAIPGVSGAIVLARDGKLVAWHASSLSASDLRDHLGRDLPDYMVPATFVALDKLPLTANGKIDRSALPDPEPEAAPDFAAPRTAREQALADIWADVLGRDRVGIHDNFFTSGGDSMRAVALAAKARDRGIRVDLGALFRHQTIAALATTLGKDSPGPSLPPLSDADQRLLPPTAETAWPMTRLQLGMVFHAQVDGAAGVYHDIFSFRLRVGWHEESFRKALNLLADRHPILRTSFDLARYSQPLQIVHREVTLPISVIDISGKDGTAQDILIAEAIAAEKANPFLLEEAPLLRIAVHLRGHGQVQITLGIHHAILDGWSVAALQVELLDCWARLRRGEPVELAPLASDYSASIAAEIEAIADPENRTWWADNLDGQGLLTLPTPTTDLGGALPDEPVRCDVEHELQTRLRDLAARLGLPLRSILLAAHLRVLALWGGTLDVTSGVVCHIRTEAPDGDKVLGLFLNTLPLRLRIQPESWRALINRVFEAELGLLAHRFYPLAQIVEDNGHQPLFDVMFNYIDFHVHDLLEDRSAELLEVSSFDVTNFGLGVNAIAQGRQLTINFAHDPRRVETRVVERIAESYLTALRSIAEDCDALADSPVVSRDQALLEQWNTTEVAYDQNGQTLTDLIEVRAASQPDEVALHFEGMEISFATLNGRANRLAHHLRSRGVGADSIVGLCAHRSIEMIVAIVAILKAGGAWLPLPPDAPADRLTMMVEDARPVLILAAPGDAADLAASLPAPVLSLAADLPAGPLTNPAPLSGPETLAYVIFTSGSTGRPKGVGVAHRAIVNRLVWMAEEYKIGPADHILQKTPFGFDVSVWELILPLITGARMVIARAEGHLDPTYLSGLMRSQRVTVTHFVPPMLDVFLAVTRPGDGTSLRAVICSGQALTRATQDRFHEAYPDCGLHNLYGPTEAAVDVTAHPCRPEDAGTTVPIGRAIANVRLYVLDETLSPLPPGVVGQLYIGGVALARGYVNRPDLTAASFIPDPFAAPGARMYRTGDLARYLPDGSIDYLGRSDDQVKIRGMRIELGEVEAALLASGPREAVVMARADAMGEAQLIAWLSGWDGNADALRAALAPRLPEQMVPSHFIGLETLPLNANGKVDRRALPDPDRVETAYLPPRTATEEALCRIWSATLGLQQISRDANFFRLGGHSLSVLRMLSTVQRELGAIVSLRTFLSCPDLESLALAIDGIHDALSEPLLDETETETILL